MKNAFNALPRIKNSGEIDKLKQVLALAANCAKAVNEYNSTTEFPPSIEVIFRRVFRKLPADLREEFSQKPVWHYSLHYLLRFLRNHISQFQLFEAEKVKEAALEDSLKKLNFDNGPVEICIYCKAIGHNTDECVFVARQLCFNCYQFGHISKKCALPPIII